MTDGDAYGGVLGAIPYAFRRSDSRLFRSYVLIGGGIASLIAIAIGLAIVVLLGQTAAAPGGTFTLVRALFVVVGLVAVGPLLAPILLVARRYRTSVGAAGYDATVALGGYAFLLSLWIALVASKPAGPLNGVGRFIAGVGVLLLGVAAVLLGHRIGDRRAGEAAR